MQEVEEYGIAKYNEKCREIVLTYRDQWKTTIERLGRWVDFENDYKTMYLSYMESVWWVFSQLHKKGLVFAWIISPVGRSFYVSSSF